ncbi:hypothetical protein N9X18_00450 [Gammaproteobacteria bacterium]|nr:hypothetical protein [Gammaproteobacteria bacterium]
MNEKYIQAIILGSIIGFAILIDDFITPQPNPKIMQKHLMVKDIKKSPKWVEDTGKEIDLHEIDDHEVIFFSPDKKSADKDEIKKIIKIKIDANENKENDKEETQKEIRIQLNTDDIADVNVESIFEEIQNQLNDDELDKVRSKLEDAKVKLDSVIADITNGLEGIEIDVQVEVESN